MIDRNLTNISFNNRVPEIERELHPSEMYPSNAPAQVRVKFDKKGRPILYYFNRRQFKLMIRFSEIFITPEQGRFAVPPEDIAFNIDRFVSISRSSMKIFVKILLLLWQVRPLLSFKLPFTWMSKEEQIRFIKNDLIRNNGLFFFELMKMKMLIYMNYYADPRTDKQTGYQAFNERENEASLIREEIISKRETELRRIRRKKKKITDEYPRDN